MAFGFSAVSQSDKSTESIVLMASVLRLNCWHASPQVVVHPIPFQHEIIVDIRTTVHMEKIKEWINTTVHLRSQNGTIKEEKVIDQNILNGIYSVPDLGVGTVLAEKIYF